MKEAHGLIKGISSYTGSYIANVARQRKAFLHRPWERDIVNGFMELSAEQMKQLDAREKEMNDENAKEVL